MKHDGNIKLTGAAQVCKLYQDYQMKKERLLSHRLQEGARKTAVEYGIHG